MQHWYREAEVDPAGDVFLELAVTTVAGSYFGRAFDSVLGRFPAQTAMLARQMLTSDAAAALLKMLPKERDMCARVLDEAGSFQKIIDDYPDQTEWVAEALVETGRFDVLFERCPQARLRCALALAARGEYERVLREYPDIPQASALSLLRTGRHERLLRDYPTVIEYALPAAVQLGRPYEYLESVRGYGGDKIRAIARHLHKSDSLVEILKAMPAARLTRMVYPAEQTFADAGRLRESLAVINNADVIANALISLYEPEQAANRYPGNLDVRALRLSREGKVDSLMAFDTQRARERTRALYRAGRYRTLRTHYPLHRTAAAHTLLALRRYREVLDSFPDQYELVPSALYGLGLLDSVLRTPSVDGAMHARALLDKDNIAAVQRTYPDFRDLQAQYLYRQGHFDELIGRYPDQTLYTGLAMVTIGRKDELPFDDGPFILGRLDKHQVLTHWALRERRAKNRVRSDSLLASRPVVYDRPGDFPLRFSGYLLPAVLEALDGDRDTLNRAFAYITEHRRYAFGQKLYYEAGYLTGVLSREQFLAQPYKVDAGETILLLDGLRNELTGDPAAARRLYEEALGIPAPLGDLVENYWLYEDEGLRSFMAWRLATVPES